MLGNKNTLKKLEKEITKIIELQKEMQKKTDEELKKQTENFRLQVKNGKKLDEILPEAFATVREASKRTIGLEHFPVQLLGGVVLHKGLIAEMRTGEGKTLVSTCPAYLNALTKKPVHIVTVNDYLARRDAELMAPVYEFLGMSVGVVLNEMSQNERKKAYECDITYVTNNELGFDYLRDNLVTSLDEKVLRGLEYCIIDEADSVLIDEARTPLIISGQSGKSTSLYQAADFLAKKMEKGEQERKFSKIDAIMGEEIEENGDFIVDEKEKRIHMTETGVKKTEEFFHINNLADPANVDIQHHMTQALKANYIMQKDKDYIIKNDEVLIIDEFTGRTMPGRRYSDGLHQAIEAKEQVDIQKESKTYATITFQNFFNRFIKKAGMTGTAKTEEKEFKNIYHMSVMEIPTNKPVIRKDHEDIVYCTKKEKYQAVVDAVKEANKKGQPVLVGTATIETSELLSKMLRKEKIKHNVLNAKLVEQEAEIIKDAGIHGSVTIATNMAGRGTDIQLDEEAKELGGLKIIGTERHESRRIDNQLRGRSGRQGDPGESIFYLSLEDELMRLFGSERFIKTFKEMGLEENEEIIHPMLSKTIENAQKKIENNHYGVREQLLKYDEINNEQRELIYAERDMLLEKEEIKGIVMDMVKKQIHEIISRNSAKDVKGLVHEIRELIPIIPSETFLETLNAKKMEAYFITLAVEFYNNLEKQFEDVSEMRKMEKMLLFRIMDRKWTNHIDNLEKLREGIGIQAYGQKDPLIEYKTEAYQMFEEMLDEIRSETIKTISHMKVAKRES